MYSSGKSLGKALLIKSDADGNCCRNLAIKFWLPPIRLRGVRQGSIPRKSSTKPFAAGGLAVFGIPMELSFVIWIGGLDLDLNAWFL